MGRSSPRDPLRGRGWENFAPRDGFGAVTSDGEFPVDILSLNGEFHSVVSKFVMSCEIK